jgi:putative nucleotidyltransferase-like protein
MRHSDEFERLIDTLKVAVAALRDRGLPFMLGGSMAAWARSGPEPQKDIDLMVKPADAQAALDALAQAGLRPEHPPEEWLYKAWNDDVLVDLIFRPSGVEINDETLARAQSMAVMSITTPVMAVEDMLVTMICAMDEHSLDYGSLVAIARSLREQIDWPELRSRTAGSPYGKAFFTLVQELGIAPAGSGRPRGQSHVRVLPG